MVETKRILVTGGTGLVGKAIQKIVNEKNFLTESETVVNEEWFFIGSKECDLTNLIETRKVFEKYKPTDVINLAAMVGGLYHNLGHNLEFFIKNLAIAQNVLQCCDEMNVQKCVSCLSTCIFPDKTEYPIDETMVHNGPPHDSNFGYSYAKRMINVLNRAYAQDKGRRYTSVIPCNVFGPNDNYNLLNAHVIPALLHKTYIAKLKNEPLVVYGSGKPLRQFIFSEDLAQLFVWTLRHYNEIDPLILAVDDEIEIADVVKEIVKAFDFKGEVIFDNTKADGQYKKTASNRKLRSYLPNYKFTPFSIAIKKSVQWFIENYKIARK